MHHSKCKCGFQVANAMVYSEWGHGCSIRVVQATADSGKAL